MKEEHANTMGHAGRTPKNIEDDRRSDPLFVRRMQ